MQDYQFTELIREIPGKMWEDSLPIGKFHDVEILQRITRPFSFLARCRISGELDSRVVYIKRYRNTRNKPPEIYRHKVEKEYRIARHWYEKFAGSQHYRVVKPVFMIPEKYISVTEESRGENLFQLVLNEARFSPSPEKLARLKRHLHNTGAWLRYKQSVFPEETEKYSLDYLSEYMDVRLKILIEDNRRHFPAEYRDKILGFIEEKKPSVGEQEKIVTISHSDFNPSNILVEGDVVTVLDFGRLVKESYLLDISKLYFQLNLVMFKPQYQRKIIRQLQEALLEGFGDSDADQLMMFRLLTMRNILTHLTGITTFWKQGTKEKIYNTWVMRRELAMLDALLKEEFC